MAIVSYTLDEIKKMRGQSDWKKLRRAMKDDSLIDYSDIPPTTDEIMQHSRRHGRKDKKKSASLRLDFK